MLILIFLFESTGTIRTKLSKKVPLPSLFSSSEIHHRKERSQDAKKGVFSDFVCGAFIFLRSQKVPSWLWTYGSWIYNYLCNQCPSLMWVWIPQRQGVPDTKLCDNVCKWLTTGQVFFARVLLFPLPITLTPRYSWNIVESGIQHHNPNSMTTNIWRHI